MAGQDNKNPGPKRVAFGNGVFVIVGEKGLIARTKDGKTWENNRTREDVGDVQCIEFNGKSSCSLIPMRSQDLEDDEVRRWLGVGIRRLAGALARFGSSRRAL